MAAIAAGVLSRAEACARYRISEAELRLGERAIACAGVPGLRVTRVQIYRPVFEAGAGDDFGSSRFRRNSSQDSLPFRTESVECFRARQCTKRS